MIKGFLNACDDVGQAIQLFLCVLLTMIPSRLKAFKWEFAIQFSSM